MHKFQSIARTIKNNRLKVGISQEGLSKMIGYKNGQFVSNVERGLCSIPNKKLVPIANILKVDPEVLIEAIIADKYTQLRWEVVKAGTIASEPDLFKDVRTPTSTFQ